MLIFLCLCQHTWKIEETYRAGVSWTLPIPSLFIRNDSSIWGEELWGHSGSRCNFSDFCWPSDLVGCWLNASHFKKICYCYKLKLMLEVATNIKFSHTELYFFYEKFQTHFSCTCCTWYGPCTFWVRLSHVGRQTLPFCLFLFFIRKRSYTFLGFLFTFARTCIRWRILEFRFPDPILHNCFKTWLQIIW